MSKRARFLCFLIYVAIVGVSEALAAEKGTARGNSFDDELFPIYECNDRSRAWTKRCLIPLTNAQFSLDLCGTGEKADLQFVKRCAKELQVLAQSCPQPGPLSSLAQDMLDHQPPPARASPPAYESLNTPKPPKAKKQPATKRDMNLL